MKQKTIAKQIAYSGFVCQVAINTDQKINARGKIKSSLIDLLLTQEDFFPLT